MTTLCLSRARGIYEKSMEPMLRRRLSTFLKVISRAKNTSMRIFPVAAKDEAKRARPATVLYNLLSRRRVTVTLLKPFMPESRDKISAQIGAAPGSGDMGQRGQSSAC